MIVSNHDDVIDSRDIIDRIEELELEDDADNADELEILLALAEEGEGCDDWRYGVTLIRESYFVEYCREMLADIGDLPRDLPEYIEIDWDATAENLRVDYTEVDFDGVPYLVR